MVGQAHESILAAEKLYKEASNNVTRVCLDIEKDCPHEFWCGKDVQYNEYGGAPLGGIYICLNCRVEVHVPYARYASTEKAPENSIVLRPNQCGVIDVYQLRIWGDKREHLHKQYSTMGGWPKREEKTEQPV